MRKKTHALTASEKPKHNAMYKSLAGLAARSAGSVPVGAAFTTFVPPRAKSKNMKVPTNSARNAIT